MVKQIFELPEQNRVLSSPSVARLRRLLALCSCAPRMSYAEFAAWTVVLPTGPYAGRRFSPAFLPAAGLLLDELDRGRPSGKAERELRAPWSRVFLVGPAQAGKTTVAQILMLYSIFERRERIIYGVPDMRMAADKWQSDLLPILRSSKLDEELPATGAASRGSKMPDAIRFRDGGGLRFMSGGGDDAAMAGYTARVVIATEIDKYAGVGSASPETDKIRQLEARTQAFGDDALFIGECTPSTTRGRVWQEYTAGTASRVVCPCPHCAAGVTPEREHLTGWQGADNIVQAQERATFACPACGAVLSEADREAMNLAATLAHTRIETNTLGFRWNAFNVLWWSTAWLAGREWAAAQNPDDEESGQRALDQLVWARPHDPPGIDLTQLEWQDVAHLAAATPRGHVPATARYLTVGIDLGKFWIHWVALAMAADAGPHVVEYDVVEVKSDALGEERALAAALREVRDRLRQGWPVEGGKTCGSPRVATHMVVDSGWHPDVVYPFIRECSGEPSRWFAAKGQGGAQLARQYAGPADLTRRVKWVGTRCHLAVLRPERLVLLEADADHWKSWLHARLRTPRGEPGACTLYAVRDLRDHAQFGRHLSAEQKVRVVGAGGQEREIWQHLAGRPNHYLDAAWLACVAGHLAGAKLDAARDPPPPTPPAAEQPARRPLRPDGRAFVASQR